MVAVLIVKEMAGRCPQPKARPSIPRRQVEPGYIGQDFLKNYLFSVVVKRWWAASRHLASLYLK